MGSSDTGRRFGPPHSPLDAFPVHRLHSTPSTLLTSSEGGEYEVRIPVSAPVATKQRNGMLGQRYATIGAALATTNVHEHCLSVDVVDSECERFGQTEPAGVDGREKREVVQRPHV